MPATAVPSGEDGSRASKTVALALIIFGSLFPIMSISAACYSRNALGRKGVRIFVAYALYIALMVALLNAGKLVEADERIYQDFLRGIQLNIHNGFARAVFDVSGRTEIGFYALSYPLYVLSGGSIKVVTIFWTLFIYGLTALSFARMFRDRLHMQQSLAIFAICTIVFVNFTLTAQVTRQYAAGAAVLASIAYFDRRAVSLALVVFAATIHYSAVLFFVPWAFVWLFGARLQRAPSIWSVILLIAGAAVCGSFAFQAVQYLTGGLLGSLFVSGLLDDGDLTVFKVLSLLAAVLILCHEMRRRYDQRFVPLLYGLLCLAVFLALVWQLPLYLLRFSFYVEFFAVLSVAMLLFRFVRFAPAASLLLLPLLANAALVVRALKSPWTYSWLNEGAIGNFSGALLTRMFAP